MADPQIIRAVTFDVGGTLIEPWPSVGDVYASVAAEFGCQGISPSALNDNFAAAWRAKMQFDYSRGAWRELVDATFAGLIPEPPSRDFFEALYGRFESVEVWRVFADVRPVLAALRACGLRLAVISNWDQRLRPLLERLDLARHFDATVVSIEAGCTKPAPEIFHRAAALLGVPPCSVVHVGDSASEDQAGARSAGMRSVLLERGSGSTGRGRIRALTELPGLLEAPGADWGLD